MKTLCTSILLLLALVSAQAGRLDTLPVRDSSTWQPVVLAYDLAHALPHFVAGLTVVNAGSNPNSFWEWRVRGLSSLDQRTQPTFIAGDLTEVPSWAVPAWALDSLEVAASGYARARHGIRGGAGVVRWHLPRPADQGRRRELEVTTGVSAVSRYYPVADAATYRSLEGATDYGSATDWQRLISRRGSHQQVRFLLNETWKGGGVFFTGGWTALEGVVRQTGFRQEQGAAVVEQALFAERLKLRLTMAATHRQAELGFAETVRYAVIANPTAPVRSDDPQYEPYGGYHQPLLFDYFNPVAIIELNRHQGQYYWAQSSLHAELRLRPWLSAWGRLGGALMAVQEDEWYHPQSLFRSWSGEGITRVFIDRSERSQWRAEAGLEGRGTVWDMAQHLSLHWWHEQLDPEHLMVRGFQQLEQYLGNTPIATLRAAPEEKDAVWTRYRHELTGFGLDYGLQPVPALTLDLLLRYDGSSWLGAEARFGWYHGLRARYDLSGKVAARHLSQLQVEASWGQSGGLPTRSAMSQWTWFEGGWVWYHGAFIPQVRSWYAPNPELQAERTSMLDLRLSAKSKSGRLSGSLAWFAGTSDGLIQDAWVASENLVADRQWRNTAALSQQGWELEIEARLIDRQVHAWTQQLQLWAVQQQVEDLFEDRRYVAPPGAPGSCCGYMVVVAPGMPVGQFIGAEYVGIDPDGKPVFRDLDGDGQIELGDPETDDTRPLGTGWPRLQLGWQHQWRFRKWHLQAQLRAAFGQRMAHMMRFFYESAEPGRVALWNRVTTRYFDRRQRGFPVFSDFYLENASFVKLDALRLGRTVALGGLVFDLSVSLENALLWSPYTGLDPELRLFDAGTSSNGSDPWAELPALAPGIDRRNTYFRAHTLALGLRWCL